MREQSCGSCINCCAGDKENLKRKMEYYCAWIPNPPFWLEIENVPDFHEVAKGPEVYNTGTKCEAWESNEGETWAKND